jgi:hypothetical protein
MRITLKELRNLVRSEVRKTLRENDERSTGMEDFHQFLVNEFNEYLEENTSIDSFGVEFFLKEKIKEYATKNYLDIVKPTPDLSQEMHENMESVYINGGSYPIYDKSGVSGIIQLGGHEIGYYQRYNSPRTGEAVVEGEIDKDQLQDFYPFVPMGDGTHVDDWS